MLLTWSVLVLRWSVRLIGYYAAMHFGWSAAVHSWRSETMFPVRPTAVPLGWSEAMLLVWSINGVF